MFCTTRGHQTESCLPSKGRKTIIVEQKIGQWYLEFQEDAAEFHRKKYTIVVIADSLQGGIEINV